MSDDLEVTIADKVVLRLGLDEKKHGCTLVDRSFLNLTVTVRFDDAAALQRFRRAERIMNAAFEIERGAINIFADDVFEKIDVAMGRFASAYKPMADRIAEVRMPITASEIAAGNAERAAASAEKAKRDAEEIRQPMVDKINEMMASASRPKYSDRIRQLTDRDGEQSAARKDEGDDLALSVKYFNRLRRLTDRDWEPE